MKSKKDTIDWKLVQAKIDGTVTEEEQHRLDVWMAESVEQRHFVEKAMRYYLREELPVLDEKQVDVAWQRFCAKYPSKKKNRLSRRLLGWSVAASVLLIFGCCWWLFTGIPEQVEEIELAGSAILPCSGKACLVLSDGSEVELDGAALTNRQADKQIHVKLDRKELVYEGSGNMTAEVYHTLRIPKGGEYCLVLSDGTKIWLNSQTELVYPVAFTGKERRVRLSGEAYLEVARNVEKPFIVETGTLNVEVLGTSFNVNAYADDPVITTTLVSGKVQLSAAAGTRCVLKPAQQALFSKVDGKTKVREVNTSLYIQWREGRFTFRDNTLLEIMRSLSRWYDMEYEFESPELEQLCFYGVISRYERVDELLRQFEKTGKVRFEYQGKKIIIKK